MSVATLPIQLRECYNSPQKGEETMRRREFIALVGGAVAAWPLTAFGKAQRRIAIVVASQPVNAIAEASGDPLWQAVFNKLRRLGYVERDNLLIERYSGEGRAAHYPDLVRDVVRRDPELIIARTNKVTLDLKAATTTIPIVGVFGGAAESGIVPSLRRPGGNITGVSVDVGPEQWEKRLQLLHEAVPQATRFGLLLTRGAVDTGSYLGACLSNRTCPPGFTMAGSPLDYPIDETAYRRVFAALARDRAEAIMVSDEEENSVNHKLIVELAARSRLPAIYPRKIFVQAGGLMSYGIDISDVGRRVADLVGEILKGARPGEIPISQPTKFELVINLKTAKALDLTVPATLLVAADEVIE